MHAYNPAPGEGILSYFYNRGTHPWDTKVAVDHRTANNLCSSGVVGFSYARKRIRLTPETYARHLQNNLVHVYGTTKPKPAPLPPLCLSLLAISYRGDNSVHEHGVRDRHYALLLLHRCSEPLWRPEQAPVGDPVVESQLSRDSRLDVRVCFRRILAAVVLHDDDHAIKRGKKQRQADTKESRQRMLRKIVVRAAH